MATLTLTITTADIDLLAKALNYTTTVPNPSYDHEVEGSLPIIANPITKGSFCKTWIIDIVQERIMNQQRQDAITAANITEADIT